MAQGVALDRAVLFAAVVVVLALAPGFPALAAEPGGLLDNRFTLSAGLFAVGSDTRVRLDGSAGALGTDLNLEQALGFRDANRFRVDAGWRIAPRHRARLLYFDTRRQRSTRIDRDIVVGDTTYPASAELDSRSSFTVGEVAYEYAFRVRDDHELLVSGGVHAVRLRYRLAGRGSVAGVSGQFSTETAAASLPMPVVGVRGFWEFRPNWYLEGQAQYFALQFDGYDGDIADVRIALTRSLGKHWGVGIGWNEFSLGVDLNKRAFQGKLDWRYSGAQAFVSASF